jgi:hypothetical protein
MPVKPAARKSYANIIEEIGWEVSGAKIVSEVDSKERLHSVFAFQPQKIVETQTGVVSLAVRIENAANPGRIYEYLLEHTPDNSSQACGVALPILFAGQHILRGRLFPSSNQTRW